VTIQPASSSPRTSALGASCAVTSQRFIQEVPTG
jgi:hypothetical protein